jgi:hypothetical protein
MNLTRVHEEMRDMAELGVTPKLSTLREWAAAIQRNAAETEQRSKPVVKFQAIVNHHRNVLGGTGMTLYGIKGHPNLGDCNLCHTSRVLRIETENTVYELEQTK